MLSFCFFRILFTSFPFYMELSKAISTTFSDCMRSSLATAQDNCFSPSFINHRKRHQPHSGIVSGRQMSIYASMMSIFLVATTKNTPMYQVNYIGVLSLKLIFYLNMPYPLYLFQNQVWNLI